MPEFVVGRPIDARQRLPLIEQGTEPVDTAAPVVAGGKLLGLFDHRLFGSAGLFVLLGTLSLAGLLSCGELGCQALEGHDQAVEVAYRVGLRNRCAEGIDRFARLLG